MAASVFRGVVGEAEEVVEGVLLGGEVGDHSACFGSAAGGGVEQHGFLDSGECGQEPRTLISVLAWLACRRMRRAMARASTQ